MTYIFKILKSIYTLPASGYNGGRKPANRKLHQREMEKQLLKIDKQDNSATFSVYCVIQGRDINVQVFASVLNIVLKSIIKCTNAFKFMVKCESFCKKFFVHKNGNHIKILFRTEASWQRVTKFIQI